MQRYSPTSPMSPNPPMTYDEASMQGSRHFFMALQELKNLRPQLYSAAEYCESSYLFNDQKQVVLDNVKDYTVKALVNAVDHLGTVAYKLNEVLSQQTSELSAAELRIAGLSQRIQMCQGQAIHDGLNQQRPRKLNRSYHKHYVLPDTRPGDRKHEKTSEVVSDNSYLVVDCGRTLSWYFAADPFTTLNGGHVLTQQHPSNFSPPVSESGSYISDPEIPMKLVESSSSQAALPSPLSQTHYAGHNKTSGRPLSAHSSFDEKYKGSGAVPGRSKSLLSTLLGRRRSSKQMRG